MKTCKSKAADAIGGLGPSSNTTDKTADNVRSFDPADLFIPVSYTGDRDALITEDCIRP